MPEGILGTERRELDTELVLEEGLGVGCRARREDRF